MTLEIVGYENPYGRITFPRELFCGPWDERDGLQDPVQQLHLGEEVARLPAKQ